MTVEWTPSEIGYTAKSGDLTVDLVVEEGRIMGYLSRGPEVIGQWEFTDRAVAMEDMARFMTEGIEGDH